MTGPKNTTELRELLASRSFPPDAPGAEPRSHQVQGPSDRMRDLAYTFGERLFGLVPDTEYQQFIGNVMHDLCTMGEQKLCQLRGVETEHAALRVLRPSEGDRQALEMNLSASRQLKPAKGK